MTPQPDCLGMTHGGAGLPSNREQKPATVLQAQKTITHKGVL
jgi:hypothetical protein